MNKNPSICPSKLLTDLPGTPGKPNSFLFQPASFLFLKTSRRGCPEPHLLGHLDRSEQQLYSEFSEFSLWD